MKKIVDLTREEAIDILLRMTQDNIYDTGNIIVLDDVITKTQCDWILDELKKNNIENEIFLDNEEFGYSVRGGKSYKIGNIKNVDNFIYQNVANKIYEALTNNLHYAKMIGSHDVVDLGYEYCRYDEGEYLKQHCETRILKYGDDRNFLNIDTDIKYLPFLVASSTLMLNDVDEGSELCFPNQSTTIKQKAGRVVIWSPDPQIQHCTNPVLPNTNRHVIVCWYALKNMVAVDCNNLTR